MKYKNITLGADPELFLQSNDGVYIPSIDLIGGTKENPRIISEAGHALQEDNVMVEFNIPPSESAEEFIDNIKFTMNYILDSIEDDLGLVAIPSAEFEWDVLEHPQAVQFGCDPYYNAYSEQQENPGDVAADNIRYAGGHIHIGYNNPTIDRGALLIKAMDLFLGVPSLLLDEDERRRETYGKAGNFRFKDYGVEYRSLSNFWVSNERLMRWVFNNVHAAIDFLNNGNIPPENIKEVIDGNNKQEAKRIIKDFKIPV